MTIVEIAERVAERLGAPPKLTWGFVQETIREVVDVLNAGEEVKIRGLGRLYWAPVKEREVTRPGGKKVIIRSGWKLKFSPASQFKQRRYPMPDKGLTKYAVVTDNETDHEKKASGNSTVRSCPVCLKELDDGGACPVHGTEPFESPSK